MVPIQRFRVFMISQQLLGGCYAARGRPDNNRIGRDAGMGHGLFGGKKRQPVCSRQGRRLIQAGNLANRQRAAMQQGK
jgi:hypothetical protein